MRLFRGIAGFLVGGALGVPASYLFQPHWVQSTEPFGRYTGQLFELLFNIATHPRVWPNLIRVMSGSDPVFRAITSSVGNPATVAFAVVGVTGAVGALLGILTTREQGQPTAEGQFANDRSSTIRTGLKTPDQLRREVMVIDSKLALTEDPGEREELQTRRQEIDAELELWKLADKQVET